ncbi:MAG: FAD-binding oxidoreductase [Spirochaetia bacterium]|nr:FAD-binding oxidoreductase [Spirochaetia bacterium]
MEMTEISNEKTGAVYKPSNPWQAVVLKNTRLTNQNSPDDVRHILINVRNSGMEILEGQSIGVIIPGTDESGKKHRVRIYSIASPREGESSNDIIALTVKRVFYRDEVTNELKKGLGSNYICDLKEGDNVQITGPIGRTFLLPEDNTTDIIMIALGTGIAPFRAFIQHMYHEKQTWQGQVLLFYGAKTGLESLYMNDENNDIGQYYTKDTFKAFKALSNTSERKLVQHKMRDNIDLIWNIMQKDKFSLYICGVKGVEENVAEVFQGIAMGQGLSWDNLFQKYKTEKRWHIEVY